MDWLMLSEMRHFRHCYRDQEHNDIDIGTHLITHL
jgi:hypothetical protein